MKKNIMMKLVWKNEALGKFMKAHGFADINELEVTEFKKLIFLVIESFLEKKYPRTNF